MTIDVLGYQRINFIDPETKQPVDGYNVFFSEPITQRGEGNAFIKKFIRADRLIGNVALGLAELDVQMSLRGKPYINSFRMVSDTVKAAAK